MRKLIPLMISIVMIGQYGCIKKKDKLKDHVVGSWDVTNHCDEFGYMSFDGDNTGQIWVNDECQVGSSCINVLPFDWTLDESTGLLTVSYDPSGSALMVCSDIQQVAPPAETTIISEDTPMIVFFGYSFVKR